MGKALVLFVLIACGYGVYWFSTHKSPAFKAYLSWSEAYHTGNCPVLQGMAEGSAKEWADNFCTPAGGMTVMGQSIPGRSAAQMVQEMNNSPAVAMQGFRHEVVSEVENGGMVSLVVIESVLARPSNFSKPAPPKRQELKLKLSGDQWKVSEFKVVEQP